MLDYVRPYASVTTELMKKKLNKKKKNTTEALNHNEDALMFTDDQLDHERLPSSSLCFNAWALFLNLFQDATLC